MSLRGGSLIAVTSRVRRRSLSFVAAMALASVTACAGDRSTAHARYRDASLATETRVRDLLRRMTLDEKFWQLYMAPGDPAESRDSLIHGVYGLQLRALRTDGDRDTLGDPTALARRYADRANRVQHFFVDSTRLGIPAILFEEAAHGLVQYGAMAYPAAIALAASWDTVLVRRVATAIAREARTRGVRQVLSPVLNLARDPRWGRVEETFGEDALLASAMGVAYIQPFERAGVVTTPKHFIANYGDGGRDSYPIEASLRQLEEVWYPPFRAAVEIGGARSVMAAYNSVDGSPAAQNHELLTETLRDAWGFRGVTISDAAGVGGANVLHFTAPDYATATKLALDAGLDVIFQSSVDQARLFRKSFADGMIAPRTIDSAVARVLRLKFALGLFERPYVNSDSAASASGDSANRRLARDAARASIVLLRNERLAPRLATAPMRDSGRRALPLDRSDARVAVIGADALDARLGGYTAPGARAVSIADALRERIEPRLVVSIARGPGRVTRSVVPVDSSALRHDSSGVTVGGLRGEYFDNITFGHAPVLTRTDRILDFSWTLGGPARALPRDWYSARWTGMLRAPASSRVRLGIQGNDGYRLWLDGRLLIDNWHKHSNGMMVVPVQLERGTTHALRVDYFETTGNGHVRLVWDQSVVDDSRARIAEAVAAARTSHTAIVVAGIEEGEFRDRSSLKLPGHQEELILAVAATGTPTVVVLVGAGAITMSPWLDRVAAVVSVWYPGQEGGRAIADMLLGDANPAGRLPMTFPMSEGQLPLVYDHKPTGRGDDYADGTGQPLFPFGHGLSYSSFEYASLAIEPSSIAVHGRATVRCRVTNTGVRAGDEVVQLYLRRTRSSVAQPIYKLTGFQRISLRPGESRDVTFTLGPTELSILDVDRRRVVEPGDVRILIGASSRDLRLRGTLTLR